MNFSTYRIIDANLNRLREGLRVIEEWCRFVLENPILAAEVKTIRHELIQIATSANWGRENLLTHRNSEEDVGTKIGTPTEYIKANEKEVLLANFSRVQEAIRVLEEFGKLENLGHLFEKLRYQTYTLEKNVMQSFTCKNLNENIYILLTKSFCKNDYFATIENLCLAGAKLFQIREKNLNDVEFYPLAQKATKIIKSFNGTIILNNRIDIAMAVGADGVHLGSEDLPLLVARKIASRPFIIGATVHSLKELNQIPFESIDYIGVGPCFTTDTKPNLPVSGIPLIQKIYTQSKAPAFAIGGISNGNINEVGKAGIKKVAICSAIISNAEPVKAYQQLVATMATMSENH